MIRFFLRICLLLSFASSLIAKSDFSIVFIHIGDALPAYAESSVCQARRFNKECPIIFVLNERALNNISPKMQAQNVTIITCESLQSSPEHTLFCRKSKMEDKFWLFTSERFLYLYDLMQQHHLQNVFHLENDIMLYADLEGILPVIHAQYQGIAATFDNDDRCIPGFIFIPNKEKMQLLARFFARNASRGFNDMQMIAAYKNASNNQDIDFLPIIPSIYAEDHQLKSQLGHTTKDPHGYHKNYELFKSIFDAAAIGQYLGGDYHVGKPGFINESALFDPSLFNYEWIPDEEGRLCPYALYKGEKIKINNLHIHCKQLERFHS